MSQCAWGSVVLHQASPAIKHLLFPFALVKYFVIVWGTQGPLLHAGGGGEWGWWWWREENRRVKGKYFKQWIVSRIWDRNTNCWHEASEANRRWGRRNSGNQALGSQNATVFRSGAKVPLRLPDVPAAGWTSSWWLLRSGNLAWALLSFNLPCPPTG